MDKMVENQDTELPWYKRYWKHIVFAFLVIFTGGMYAAMQARQKQNNVVNKLDELDQEVIEDKVNQANVLGQQVVEVVKEAEQISSDANKQLDAIKQDAIKPVDQQVADLNSFMRDRR